jgi:predicted GNAT family acetyltransferase
MNLTTYHAAATFLERVEAVLEKEEVVNGVMLGISYSLRRAANRVKTPPYLATIEDEDSVILAAMMTPPQALVLYSPAGLNQPALELVARNLFENNWPVSKVLGPPELSKTFAEHFTRISGRTYSNGLRERIYELTEVIMPQKMPSGQLRGATQSDLEIVTDWFEAFEAEALGSGMTRADAERVAKARVEAGEIYLWEDTGKVVSMAGKSRPTKQGITVNAVYTPPELRGHGYASACVAQLSQLLLDSGYRFCTLFTDLANPTSNSIYQKIGYRPVCDFYEYLFEKTFS